MDDLDKSLGLTLRSGHGRAVLASILAGSLGPVPLGATPEATAYALGMKRSAEDLSAWIKSVDLEHWLLLQREMASVKDKPVAAD